MYVLFDLTSHRVIQHRRKREERERERERVAAYALAD
jgi:hypothetical protein